MGEIRTFNRKEELIREQQADGLPCLQIMPWAVITNVYGIQLKATLYSMQPFQG
jgi:hypothetical protein